MLKQALLFGFLFFVSFFTIAQSKEYPVDIKPLMSKYICTACHKVDTKLVGPAFTEIAKKNYSNATIVDLIANPVPSHWPGYPPMAAQKNLLPEDALKIAIWINSLNSSKKATKTKKK